MNTSHNVEHNGDENLFIDISKPFSNSWWGSWITWIVIISIIIIIIIWMFSSADEKKFVGYQPLIPGVKPSDIMDEDTMTILGISDPKSYRPDNISNKNIKNKEIQQTFVGYNHIRNPTPYLNSPNLNMVTPIISTRNNNPTKTPVTYYDGRIHSHSARIDMDYNGTTQPISYTHLVPNCNYDQNTPTQNQPRILFDKGSNVYYNKRSLNYDQRSPNYDQRSPNYDQRSPNYDQRSLNYDQSSPNYNQRSPNYDQRSPNYNQRSPNYDQRSPNYNQSNPNYDQRSPNYNQRSPNYDQRSPNYDQRSPNYNQRSPNYDQSSLTNYDQSSPTNYDKSSLTNYDQSSPINYDQSSATNYDQSSPINYDQSSLTNYDQSSATNYDKNSTTYNETKNDERSPRYDETSGILDKDVNDNNMVHIFIPSPKRPKTGDSPKYEDLNIGTFEERKSKQESKGERICREFLEKYYEKPFPRIRPYFLVNPSTGCNLELDGYNSELNIGFEYQGVQHYIYPNKFHKNEEVFKQQLARDKYKVSICENSGVYLIVVPWNVPHEHIPKFIKQLLPHKYDPSVEIN